MGKRSQKHCHVGGCEKSGCVWSFVSMLDFRYGRFAPKMLLDRRCHDHIGTGNQKHMHNMRLNADGNNQDGEENVVDKRRPSVKELIEEDLLSELLSKSDTMSAEVGFISEWNRTRASNTTTHRKGSELPCPHNSVDVDDHRSQQLKLEIISPELCRNKSDKVANLELETAAKEPSGNKQHKFFRRKSKSFDNKKGSLLNKAGSESETNKGRLERSSSHFSLTEIKKKLKIAMGREQLEGDRTSLSGVVRKVENDATRPVECCNKGKEQYQAMPRQSNICVEGVKKNAKPLSRILSFPDHNSSSSSVASPGIDLWYGAARMSFPNMDKFQSLGRISLSSELSDEDHKALQVSEMNVDEVTTQGGSAIEFSGQMVASEEINTMHYAPGTSNYSDAICQRSEDSDHLDHLDLVSKELSYVEEISPESHSAQPLRIQFGEGDREGIGLKRGTGAKHCIVEFIENVVVSSGLNWEELSDYPDQILDPSSCQEMELFPNQLCDDKQLLFDCIDEVLVEIYDDCKYLNCQSRPVGVDMDNSTIQEVWERVHWHLNTPIQVPHSLEQIVERDMDNKNRSNSWMKLGGHSRAVLMEISESIFEDVVQGILHNIT
ncbi:Protein TRM32 [Linum grandiflorum]